jgi:hypothetical protein
VNVSPPDVNVDFHAPDVNVSPPNVNVNVEPPAVNVESPEVNVDFYAPDVNVDVQPPNVTVNPPAVNVDVSPPAVTVNIEAWERREDPFVRETPVGTPRDSRAIWWDQVADYYISKILAGDHLLEVFNSYQADASTQQIPEEVSGSVWTDIDRQARLQMDHPVISGETPPVENPFDQPAEQVPDAVTPGAEEPAGSSWKALAGAVAGLYMLTRVG